MVRYIRKGKKTHAKDENFDQDNVGEEKERFQVSIDLISLKTLTDEDIGFTGEFYFKTDGPGNVFKSRFPHSGEIKLAKNQTFTSKADMNVWSQFETIRRGEDSSITVKVELREKDPLIKDEVIAEQEITIDLPQKTKYIILQDKDEQTKAKLRIQSTRTRY
ncbi:MAG: hypothetical protein BAJALOKI3v1_620012 [Promethearchaeota archaeon]|jgi:hypothetical protein|nr:MAG: hypothetical protein BAJALOKI3v1_620012 [Candidatus Lokiarchaeota archaeon]